MHESASHLDISGLISKVSDAPDRHYINAAHQAVLGQPCPACVDQDKN